MANSTPYNSYFGRYELEDGKGPGANIFGASTRSDERSRQMRGFQDDVSARSGGLRLTSSRDPLRGTVIIRNALGRKVMVVPETTIMNLSTEAEVDILIEKILAAARKTLTREAQMKAAEDLSRNLDSVRLRPGGLSKWVPATDLTEEDKAEVLRLALELEDKKRQAEDRNTQRLVAGTFEAWPNSLVASTGWSQIDVDDDTDDEITAAPIRSGRKRATPPPPPKVERPAPSGRRAAIMLDEDV